MRGKRCIPEPDQIPGGICECGCGRKTSIAKVSIPKRRNFLGHPLPYIHGHSSATAKRGTPEHHKYRGGSYVDNNGYKRVKDIGNPQADKDGFILEHRLVMSRYLGRAIEGSEIIHHRNGNRLDNRIENLEIMNRSTHRTLHAIKWVKDTVIEKFKEHYRSTGKLPNTFTGNITKGFPNHRTIKRIFGSLEQALIESGLKSP